MYLSIQTPFQFVFFLGLIQIIVASIRWRSPQYRSSINFRSDTYFCGNEDKVNNNQPYEPKKIFWVRNKAYEVEMDFSMDAGNRQNYSMKMWRVIWRQNQTNLTQILSPEVKEKRNVYGPTEMTSAEGGILKLSDNPTKLNISIENRLVCRPEEFACALVIEQNRTGNEGKAWRSCSDVLILSEDNNVTLTMTMNAEKVVLVASFRDRMFTAFGNEGFTKENVYQVVPPFDFEDKGQMFNVVNNKYSVTFQISDMKGFNSETVANYIKNTLLVTDKGRLDNIDVASIDIEIGSMSSATYLRGGMGVTVAIVFVLLSSVCA